MGEAQLDITFVSQDQNLLGVLTMTSNPDRDPLLLEGSLSNLIREEVINLFIELPQDQLSVLSISEGEGSVVLLDDEGLSTDYSLSSYSVVSAIDDRYEIFSGVSTDPDGNTFDFVASTDRNTSVRELRRASVAPSECRLWLHQRGRQLPGCLYS